MARRWGTFPCSRDNREGAPTIVRDFLDPIRREQAQLLALVDKLQGAPLTDIDIPQIVVVGDQSSGKSSVLEAISGLPFPRAAGACTKFATEIRLRCRETPGLRVEIIPDPSTKSSQSLEKLHQFGKNVNPDASFEDLFREAADLLNPKDKFATRDVLVVEKFGPDLPLLTLVDLPGLVRNPNNDQNEADIAAIDAITDDYMQKPRSIILAVVGGNADYAQAIVLRRARKFDPQGRRTIGVLTKPDCTRQIALEDKFLNLVANRDRENQMLLGWYVMLNPEPNISWPTLDVREQKEREFFKKKPWAEVPRERRGMVALRAKLSAQLLEHVAESIPGLRMEISAVLDSCKKELETLGYERDDVNLMRKDIWGWFEISNNLAKNAISGDYSNNERSFFPHEPDPQGTPPQNLRARAVEANRLFAETLKLQGHSLGFRASDHTDGADSDNLKSKYARDQVAKLIEQSMGEHLEGERSHRIAYWLFKTNSSNWDKLATDHLNKISEICNEFLTAVLHEVWPTQMHEPLRQYHLNDHKTEFHRAAVAELKDLNDELAYNVKPYDPDYKARVDKLSREHEDWTVNDMVLEQSLIIHDVRENDRKEGSLG